LQNHQRLWAEINLDNLAQNVKIINNMIPKTSKFMAVVKADGYGHGSLEVAKVCLYNGADILGVAILDEGIHLRENNIPSEILVLGYTESLRLSNIVKYDLTQTIFNKEMAQELNEHAKNLNKKAKIHIKIDTGLSRLGFLPSEMFMKDIEEIKNLPYIEITGCYTHFAEADSTDTYFTTEQYNKFIEVKKGLESIGLSGICFHVSNSAAILKFSDYSLDISRAGIILYGLSPSPDIDVEKLGLLPVMSLKTRISNIKTLKKGVSVGYARTFFTSHETVIATIPVGYADGYARANSNKGKVLVNGEYANIIGRICMDQMMIDITNIKDVKPEDTVTLIGEDDGQKIRADEIAQTIGTIAHEVVCAIGKRVPRVYIKNGQIIKVV